MSYCNNCGKWAGAFAAPAGANTDHLCKCLTPAQQRILDAIPPAVGSSASDWELVGYFMQDGGRWLKMDNIYANDPDAVPLYRKRNAGVLAVDPVQAERERCARIADDEARIREEAGRTHPEDSEARGRCFAAARAAQNVAKGIRSGEVVDGVSGGQHQVPCRTDADGSSLDAIPQEPK